MQQQTILVVDPSDLIATGEVTWNLANCGRNTTDSYKSIGCVCSPATADSDTSSQCSLA